MGQQFLTPSHSQPCAEPMPFGPATTADLGRPRRDARRHAQPVALHLASRPAGSEAPRCDVARRAGVRQDHHRPCAVPLQMGDRCPGAGRCGQRCRRALAVPTPVMLVVAYGVGRTVDTAFNQLRDALFARSASTPSASSPLETSPTCTRCRCAFTCSGAPAGSPAHRARHQGHRDHRPLHHAQHAADDHRIRLRRRHLRLPVSASPFSPSSLVMIVALYLVHGARSDWRIAHPPRDERVRHRRQLQGDRQAAQLRDRQIFRQRGAWRPSASTRSMARYRDGRDPHLDLARLAQFRPGRDLLRRHDDRAWSCRPRRHARQQDGRRFRADQHAADAALRARSTSSASSTAKSARAWPTSRRCSSCSTSGRRSRTSPARRRSPSARAQSASRTSSSTTMPTGRS